MPKIGTTGRAATTYLVLAGLQRGVSMLILPFVSHAMSPAEYGTASVLTVSAALLVAIVAAPVEQLVFRSTARGGDDAAAILRTIGMYCYFVLPMFIAVVAAGVALWLPESFGASGPIWAIQLLSVGLQPAATYYAIPRVRAAQLIRKFVWLTLISVLASAISKLLFVVIWQMGVLGWVLSDLCGSVVSLFLALAVVGLPRARIAMSNIRAVLSFSVPLIPHQASFWALTCLSRPALAAVSSLAQVGLLSFGLNLTMVASLIITEVNQAVMPHYSRETFPAPTNETREPGRWQLLLAVTAPALIGAGLALAGPWMFAEPYWPAFALTGILLFAQFGVGLYVIPMNYLVLAAGLPRFSAIASFSGAVFIFIGILMFGRGFGAVGVAYVTAIGFVLMAVIAFIITRVFRLNIVWSSWKTCWPELLVGTASLVSSTLALTFPVGSASSYGFGGLSLALILATFAVTSLRRPFSSSVGT